MPFHKNHIKYIISICYRDFGLFLENLARLLEYPCATPQNKPRKEVEKKQGTRWKPKTNETSKIKRSPKMTAQGNETKEMAREEIYSPKKVAEILDVNEAFVLRLLRSGNLKGFKMGKFWRVTESALTEYCISNSNNNKGKSTISSAMRNKIKFHANIKSQNKMPEALERMEKAIKKIKRKLPDQGKYQKVAMVAKLKALVEEREEILRRLEEMPGKMEALAEKAYAEATNLIDQDPDDLEALFRKIANGKPAHDLQMVSNQ